jgi:hypothetical protein
MLKRQNKGRERNQLNPLDAVTAAPDHHRILFENDRVRVLDTRIGPGEITPIHIHQWPSVLYVLNWSDVVRRDTKGNVLLDTRKSDSMPQASTIFWSEALMPHSAMNVGREEIRIIAVELKTPDAGTSQ